MAGNNMTEAPKGIDTPIELKSIGVEIKETGKLAYKDTQYDWSKISFHGQPLNIPLLSKKGENISNRISSFLTKMTHESCREQLGGLIKTCSVDEGYDLSSGKFIGLGDKKIVTAEDFSDFVGISIIRGDRNYEGMRDLLDKLGIYPRKKTMIEDFRKQWDNTPTDPLYAASGKQDTLADFGNKLKVQLEPLLVALGKKEKTPPGEVTAIRGKKPTDPLK